MKSILMFLINHFSDLLDLNLTASIVIIFILCVRQFLKGAPKVFSYALWGIVLLRLLVPVSIESSVSFVPERTEFSSMVEVNEVLPEIQFETPADREINEWHVGNTPSGELLVQVSHSVDAETYLTFAWLTGIASMLLYSAVSYWRLRRRVRAVIPLRKGIYIADQIDTPFVMGIFRPVIYLPDTLNDFERRCIIAHERHHIRRGDHIFKSLMFLALTIHWFNPFVWVAFVFASRDMEMSCDEAVVRKLGENIRADYSATLLNLATGQRRFAITPLAFGEEDPTGRVRNLAKWKKPAVWVIVICVILCIVLAVCLLTDPEKEFDWSVTRQEGASCALGDFNYTAPDGLSVQGMDVAHDGNAWDVGNAFYVADTLVGGVALRYQDSENGPKAFTQEWEKTIGIPEASDDGLAYIGSSSAYADYEITYFPDLPVNYDDTGNIIPDEMGTYVIENEVTHYLFLNGDEVYDLWFYINRLSEDMQKELLESVYIQTPANAATDPTAEISDWGISIKPEYVTKTGAAATFICGEDIEGVEFTYGEFLALERMENSAWEAVEELPGFEYYVSDSVYPVVAGTGMAHFWENRFGQLPDGQYRIGKMVTARYRDGITEERMVYGYFSIPESILTGYMPLEELPEKYSGEQAMIDGCFVQTDSVARENRELFKAFAEASYADEPSSIRIVDWHYGENSYYEAYDLSFDGRLYTINWIEDGQLRSREFPYLRHFAGEADDAPYDAYEHYVLVHDDQVTWNVWGELIGSHATTYMDHMTVYSDYIYRPKVLRLPANLEKAVLAFEGENLVSTTDFDRLEKIWLLLADAELLGYEPKSHSVGVGLNLVLYAQDGETVTIELDPDNDICRIGGEFIFYGAPDEPCYIEKLWYYLGVESWPDVVYDRCPNAFRIHSVG